MKGTVEDLARFMAMNPTEADALDASFFLGAAYNNTNQHEKAVPMLVRFVEGDKKSKTRDYAMVLLAQSYQESKQPEKALETVREALANYPASQYLGAMKARLNSVKRQMGLIPDAAPAPAVAAPATPAAQPAAPAPAPATAQPAPR